MRSFFTCMVGMVALGLVVRSGQGENWPQFRGPNGSAVSSESALPTHWSAGENVAWKVKLPGYGWSCPIVWGNKIILTTAVADKQAKPSAGFMMGGPGGPGGERPGRAGGRQGGFGGMPQPGQVLPAMFQDRLKLSEEQKKDVVKLQKEVDDELASLLGDEQKKQLKQPAGGPGRGPGGFRGFPQPGQVLSPALRDSLKLTDEQKKKLDTLQKAVDDRLAKSFNDEQNKQLKEMREGMARGPGGFGRGAKPPDVTYKWEVYCLNADDGRVLWKRIAAEGKPTISINSSNTYATETPVTDGERIYAYFGMNGVYCFDFDGNELWKHRIESHPIAFGHGTASSPVFDEGRVFIQCDNEEKSFLLALDAKTGKELWKTPRTEHTSWSSPLVWKNKNRTEIVCLGSPSVRSYDPKTGKQLWELKGTSGQPKATPLASEDLLYVGTGGGPSFGGGAGREGGFASGKPLFAVKAGASGDISLKEGQESNAGIAWHLPQAGPSTASPLLYEGRLYVLEDRGGFLNCFDAKSGEKIYKERIAGARGFTSSPWAYDGKLFCLDDGGTTHVIKAGPEFEALGKNAVGEMCWSSPAAAHGALFLRTVDHLFCIRQSAKSK